MKNHSVILNCGMELPQWRSGLKMLSLTATLVRCAILQAPGTKKKAYKHIGKK